MLVIGLIWFVSQLLRRWMEPLPLTVGIWLGDFWLLPLAFLLAGFPLGRLSTPAREDHLLGALTLVMIPLEFLWLMFLNFDAFGEPGVPENVCWSPTDLRRGVRRHGPAHHPCHLPERAGLGPRAPLVRRQRAAAARRSPRCSAGAAGDLDADGRLPAGQVRARPRAVFHVGARHRCPRSRSSSWSAFCAPASRARSIGDLLVDLKEPPSPARCATRWPARCATRPSNSPTGCPSTSPTSASTASRRAAGEHRPRRRPSSSATTRRIAALIHDASLAGRAAARRRRHLRRRDRARERAPAGRPAGPAERPAGLARPDRRGRRHRAPQARARPPRRRPAAARRALESSCASSPASVPAGEPGGRAAGHGPRGAQRLAGGAAQHRARHPPRDPHRPRPVGRAGDPRRPRAGPRRRSTSTSPTARRRRSRSPPTT